MEGKEVGEKEVYFDRPWHNEVLFSEWQLAVQSVVLVQWQMFVVQAMNTTRKWKNSEMNMFIQ